MTRILLIEDDPDILALIAHKLRRAGHEVTSEMDGLSGLEAVRRDRPDLVVLDWMMPGMTGLELCRTVRADAEVAHTRIMMLTAKAQPHDLERAYAVGADDYLLKPFRSAELLQRVAALLARD